MAAVRNSAASAVSLRAKACLPACLPARKNIMARLHLMALNIHAAKAPARARLEWL
jgi:hypothetical protein